MGLRGGTGARMVPNTAVMSARQAKRKPGCLGTMAPGARALFAMPPKVQWVWHRLLHTPAPDRRPPPIRRELPCIRCMLHPKRGGFDVT